jgi:hypothetical protein
MSILGEWRPDSALLASVVVTVPVLALQLRSDPRVRAVFGLARPSSDPGPVTLPQPARPPPAPPATSPPPLPPATRARSTRPPAEPPLDRPAAENRPAAAPGHRAGRAGRDIDDATVPIIRRPPANRQANGSRSSGSPRRRSTRPPAQSSPELIGNGLISLARLEVAADRAAVLVPHAGVWTVAAGANLSAEQRAVRLTAEHRMIQEVLREGRPLLADAIGGRPADLDDLALPPSEHMLALPLAEAESLILLARADPPFLGVELQLLKLVLAPQGVLLKMALEMREFGEALNHVFDEAD